MLDFYNAIKKLFMRLRVFTESTIPAVGKETAAGYAHTYSDCRGIDLTALSAFPTDEQINTAARQAYEEAENLLFILGISPDLCNEPATITTPSTEPTATPWEWVDEPNDEDGEEAFDEAAEISHLYEYAEALEGSSISPDHQRLVKDLSYASVLLHTRQDMDL